MEKDDDLEAELAAQFDGDSGLTRRQREELEEKAEADAKIMEKAAKDSTLDNQREVAVQIARLVKEAKDGRMTLNMLNQAPGCKKVLKPLCKKEGVKSINKAWLEKFGDVLCV